MSANRCARCGANLALVGTVHRCVPRVVPEPVEPAPTVKQTGANYPGYRDKDKRRAYMRDYMRTKRERNRKTSPAP